jgi:hypothetical protein
MWRLIPATVHLPMKPSCMPGLGQGFRDLNLVAAKILD